LIAKRELIPLDKDISFFGAEDLLRSNGVDLTVLHDNECIAMMEAFIEQNPDLWNEDIGE